MLVLSVLQFSLEAYCGKGSLVPLLCPAPLIYTYC